MRCDVGLEAGGKLAELSLCIVHCNQWRRNEFESGGHRSGTKVGEGTDPAQKNFLVVPLHFFDSESTIVVLVSDFVMVGIVWPVSCLLFFYSRCPVPSHL